MGLIGCALPVLARDTTLTLLSPEHFVARPALWLRTLSRYRATLSPAPNFAYALCVSRIAERDLEGVDLSSWCTALNGAEAIAPAVLRAFEERFSPYGLRRGVLTPVYGLSEAALAVTFSELGKPYRIGRFDREALSRQGAAVSATSGIPAESGREIVSVGRPLPGFAVRIADRFGRPLPEGRVGRIWASGPSLMTEYLDDPQATARVLQEGWLDTGDLGFLDAGELFLTGRAKDVIILRGRNHSPEEIERAVETLPGVRPGCAVAASWLPEGGEREVLGLFVERRREVSEGELAALPEACRTAVLSAAGLAVDEVVLLAPGSLPRTSSGKLRRAETVRLHLAGALLPPRSASPLRLMRAVASSQLAYARSRIERLRGGADG